MKSCTQTLTAALKPGHSFTENQAASDECLPSALVPCDQGAVPRMTDPHRHGGPRICALFVQTRPPEAHPGTPRFLRES